MRTLLTALLGAALALSAAGAQQPIDRRFALSATGFVKMYNFTGSIRVVGWDKDSVVVAGTMARGMRFFGGGSREAVKLGVEGEGSGADATADLVVHVPATANVWVRGAATTITVEGLIGTVDIGSVAGAVRITGAPRELLAETMDGTLEIVGSPGVLRAKTATGALRWRGGGAEATLTSVSGEVTTEGGSLGRARVETVSGNVLLLGALRPDASVTVESHSGSVTLRVPRDVPMRLTADVVSISGVGIAGKATAPAGRRSDPRLLEYNKPKPGGRAAEVSVRSFKGAMELRQ
jgi:hypothetical protein